MLCSLDRYQPGIAALMVSAGLLAAPSLALAHSEEEALQGLQVFFQDADPISGPEIVDCTLSEGTQTRCFSITFRPAPSTYTPGPFCPANIADGAEAGGIWFEDGEVYDVDGAFIEQLAEFYSDPNWQLFDPETGEIQVTDTQISCEAAARPNVDPDYQNHCVQCEISYMEEGSTITYVIPIEPQAATRPSPTNFSGSGIARNGVRLDGPAPVDDILGAYTIAPFDDCGGHVNPHVGYHYHAVTGCLTDTEEASADGSQPDSEAPIGIAMDGYPIFAHSPDDEASLDTCNGQIANGMGYLYRAGAAGSNAILGCLSAQAGCVLINDPDAVCDASAVRPGRPN